MLNNQNSNYSEKIDKASSFCRKTIIANLKHMESVVEIDESKPDHTKDTFDGFARKLKNTTRSNLIKNESNILTTKAHFTDEMNYSNLLQRKILKIEELVQDFKYKSEENDLENLNCYLNDDEEKFFEIQNELFKESEEVV